MNTVRMFRIARFSLAGVVNTGVNFIVLNLAFNRLHYGELLSMAIATVCAIGVSFVLNRSFVFLDKTHAGRAFTRFAVVSMLGTFLVQNVVYALAFLLLQHYGGGAVTALHRTTGLGAGVAMVNASNVLASLAVAFWNYNGYRLFVFSSKATQEAGVTNAAEAA